MRIEIVEVGYLTRAAGRQSRRAEIAGLHHDHHRLGDQRPTAGWKPESFLDAELPDRRNQLGAADRNPPAMLAAVHVDGENATERGLAQRQSAATGAIPAS